MLSWSEILLLNDLSLKLFEYVMLKYFQALKM